MFGAIPLVRRQPTALPPYEALATYFGGSAGKFRGANLTGAVDNKQFAMSVWLKADRNGSSEYIITSRNSGQNGLHFRRGTNNGLVFSYRGTSDNTVVNATISTTLTIADGWTHFFWTFDLANSSNRALYRNGVNANPSWTTYNNANCNHTTGRYDVGYRGQTTANYWKGDMCDPWINFEYLDVATHLEKFIDGDGKPVFLGDNGQLPTGNSPILFLTGAHSAWHTNKGTGGGFSQQGTTTPSSSSPSD